MGLRQLLWLLLLLRCTLEAASRDDPKREVLVKEVVLDSAVVDIVYLGKNHECVLVTTKNKRLYFSEDSGQSWSEITSKVDSTSNAQIQVDRILVNPTDKTVAVLQTKRRLRSSDVSLPNPSSGTWWPYIYITEDSGRTWRRAWGKHHGLHSWISHPKERSWALVSWWAGDCNGAGQAAKKTDSDSKEDEKQDRQPCVHRLMLTKDLGRNFLQLAEYVVQFSWGSSSVDQSNRVYYTAYRTKSGDQGRLSVWTSEVDFNYVGISKAGRPMRSPVRALRYGNKFLISGEFILVAKVRDEAKQTVHLMVSTDGAKTFKAALLPSGMGELEEKWYTVLDTSEGSVILHLNSNAEGAADTGRVFVSDGDGYKYSQSLINNVRSSQGECEFDKVVSLQGVYMANVVVPDNGGAQQSYQDAKVQAQDATEKEAAGGTETDKRHSRGSSKAKVVKASKEERTIRTVVSFDKGGAWSYLKAPRVNSLGKEYECAGKPVEECALHLHGTTSWDMYAPFYSSESSIGIVMGTGNVGSKLRFEPEETCTFLSRDGGLTWSESHKGAFIYEFGDHGGLIVMADDLKKTSEVLFTWNEGESWYDFKVSKVPFEVDNIITEPNATATTFIMFGTREEGVGVLYYMKFDSLQFPACKGAWAADSVSSDYETWLASDGVNSEKCLLGQQVTYTRRKRTSQCWNGEKFQRPTVQKRCSCTQEDFACDIGFVRSVGSTDCVYGGIDMMPERFLPSVCSKTFSVNAYRKVPGDQCEGGWMPSPADVPCPSLTMGSSYAKWALLLALVAGLAYMGFGGSVTGMGGSPGFGEFAAKTSWSPIMLLQWPLQCLSWLQMTIFHNSRGFKAHGSVRYKKVQGDEFDMDGMDGGNEESLTDFIDEAEYDDHAPRIYDSAANDKKSLGRSRPRQEDERPGIASGGLQAAREEVPRLKAPPGSKPQGAEHFDIADSDQDLL